ncbi:ABC transporter ATP-binding protein [Streptomyces phaeolivaceus]|uniref:ABC transporter ATP-binding protein n=1 Tax=Streptomyces phaeolivaceus TaxID=2653200 RepID=A0A5P8KJA6_9ACTN|nr:ATP-binding cassette domain-containing protein [Streptomyces phaeolivaceus]QFR03137.1 ABC transporter ATP-binding protein [Streptomyces phaeolivaceus]
MQPQLEVRDLRKEYPVRGGEPIVAVESVSFTVPSGGSLAVVGESGSGKTTCARLICRLEQPTSGSVLFAEPPSAAGERELSPRLRRAREVQMVFQDPYASLDPRQTVTEAVAEILKVHGVASKAERARRVNDLLDKVGLPERVGSSKPRRLSGGQRQRVAIMKALAVQPRLLILDEAVSALDVSVQAQVINLLADLREAEGLTYLFISHDLGVVRQISDTCIVMRHGVVVEQGATEEVLDSPTDPYTQQLIDAVPRPGWKPRVRSG